MIPATRWSKRCRPFPPNTAASRSAATYDVYSLLRQPAVQAFVGTPPYRQHKDDHFPQADNKNQHQRRLSTPDRKTRELYERAYEAGSALYYQGKPSFTEILAALDQWKDRL
jgi:hypothetical protein